MYRLTNLTQNTTTTYKNRDLVYQALERENAKVKHQEAEAVLLVEELDKKNVVIYQEDVYLPFEGIADSLFLKPGTLNNQEAAPKEAKTSFFKRQTKTKRLEKTPEENAEVSSMKHETPKPRPSSKRSFGVFLGRVLVLLGLVGSLTLAGLSLTLVYHQEKQLTAVSEELSNLKTIQSKTGELDAFSRYFLPAFYSDKGKIADFVAPQLTIDRQAGQLQSVILESSLMVDETTYQLTYVVAVKDGENRSQKRLVVTVKEEPSAPYGFQVIAKPELSNYPK
ncbi:hypothetical protein NE660_04625 [Streptococcus oralis]|uniref:hypothetical protein n=1 Tax=Streptococcus oralis TaxID=1303 RepID=UPI00021D1402|nr:hypothetical protein [Streptococcus oralis]EGV02914.1 conserved domain protein [Streptococcus infantis SK970]MCQ5168968.1 hypothetical protein [Streptococcus oralis]HEP5734575.1 hypothetical protein [Streptococcus pyogenes]HEW2855852.1 hypothetical protein [Streptococcus pneumoniae]